MKLGDASLVTVTVTGNALFTSDKVSQLLGVLCLFWLLLVAVGAATTWFAARNLVQPYTELVDRLASIVETGDFTTRIDVESNDEAGQIAAYVGQVLDGQRVILKALKRSGEGLQNVISQLFDVGELFRMAQFRFKHSSVIPVVRSTACSARSAWLE